MRSLWRARLLPSHLIQAGLGHESPVVITQAAQAVQTADAARIHASTSTFAPYRSLATRDAVSSSSLTSAAFSDTAAGLSPVSILAAAFSNSFHASSFSTAAAAANLSPPKPLPRYRKPYKDEVKWKKMVIRFPSSVEAQIEDRNLRISGPAGAVTMDLKHMDPTGLVAMDYVPAAEGTSSSSMLLCASPSKRNFKGINTHISNAIYGVTQGYLIGVTVKGVGYRFEAVDNPIPGKQLYFEPPAAVASNAAYPHPKPVSAVRLKVGFTGSAVFQFPEYIRCFVIQPTLMYLYGLQLDKVKSIAKRLCMVKKPNPYTGNGLRLTTETLRLKSKSGGK